MPSVLEVTNGVTAVADPVVDEASASNPHAVGLVAPPTDWHGFVERDGYVAMEAEDFSRNTDTATARWKVLPDHGNTLSAMTIFPVTAPTATPPGDSPCLEYQMWLTLTGRVEVTLILSPCLNFDPSRGVRIAVSFYDERPQVITVVPNGYTAGDGNHDWEESVRNSVRKVKTRHSIDQPGPHTFKVWMVDPAVVLQRIVVDAGGVKPSYLGPPESVYHH